MKNILIKYLIIAHIIIAAGCVSNGRVYVPERSNNPVYLRGVNYQYEITFADGVSIKLKAKDYKAAVTKARSMYEMSNIVKVERF